MATFTLPQSLRSSISPKLTSGLAGLTLLGCAMTPATPAPSVLSTAPVSMSTMAGAGAPLLMTSHHAEAHTSRGGERPVEMAVAGGLTPASEAQVETSAELPASDDAAVTREPAPSSSGAPAAAATPATPRGTVTHVVEAGDTVSRLAKVYGLQPETIVWANNLSSADRIALGQRLRIPAEDMPAPQPSTAARTGTGAQPTQPARNSQEAFIFSLVSGAQESQRRTGVPASVTIAQGILESSWGRSRLSTEGNNYFGIKAHTKEGPAGVIWMPTWEVLDGENVMVDAPFRRYNNVAESLIDHGYFFVENRRYARALEAQDDPREFARRINAAGYATDPEYAPKLISLMDRYDLYRYDLKS